jgi:hypothetical protein
MSERSIFMEALEFDDPQERAAYLGWACGGDPRLRERVEALLRSHRSGGRFVLDRVPAADLSVTADVPPAAAHPGTVIGPYKLLEPIGERGMGIVFMAEQQRPVRRKVALKILKPGMDTRQVVARFEAERQALALVDHPHITRVFDGGETDGGLTLTNNQAIGGTGNTAGPRAGDGIGCGLLVGGGNAATISDSTFANNQALGGPGGAGGNGGEVISADSY